MTLKKKYPFDYNIAEIQIKIKKNIDSILSPNKLLSSEAKQANFNLIEIGQIHIQTILFNSNKQILEKQGHVLSGLLQNNKLTSENTKFTTKIIIALTIFTLIISVSGWYNNYSSLKAQELISKQAENRNNQMILELKVFNKSIEKTNQHLIENNKISIANKQNLLFIKRIYNEIIEYNGDKKGG